MEKIKMRIAICDDINEIANKLYDMLQEVLKERDITAVIDVYTSGEALYDSLEAEKYDLIFLDIEMPGKDGLAIGKYIREYMNDNITQIVYITSNQSHSIEVHDIRPLNFLVKPLIQEKVAGLVDTYMRIMGSKVDVLKVLIDREIRKIDISHIEYMQSNKRKIALKINGETLEFYGKLEEVYTRVKRFGFLFIHKSIIVNPNFVKKFEPAQVIMTDETILPISRAHKTAVTKMLKEYMRR